MYSRHLSIQMKILVFVSSFCCKLKEHLFEWGIGIDFIINEQDIAFLLTVFITIQRQLLLMLELHMNDNKRITHIPSTLGIELGS